MNIKLTPGRILGIGIVATSLSFFALRNFKVIDNQQYEDFKIAESGYVTYSRENDLMKIELEKKDEQLEELAQSNEAFLQQINDYKSREIPENTRLRYDRTITSLETDVLRLQKEKLLLEKRVVEYEKSKADMPQDPTVMKLKEKIASLESDVSTYKIEYERTNMENNQLRRNNPKVQYLKELVNRLQIQNSEYQQILDSLGYSEQVRPLQK